MSHRTQAIESHHTDLMAYEPGTRVEVLNSFGRWSRGFEIASACENGSYKIKRLSDASVLPVDLDAEAVRRERRKHDFWWF